jgi:nucleotide-binding universal stress UspA family protein
MNTETETSRPGDAGQLTPVMLKLKSILVPIDFSKISQTALEYAVPLAEQFGAKVTLLHAIEPLPYPVNLTHLPMGEGFPIKLRKDGRLQDDCTATLERGDGPSGDRL